MSWDRKARSGGEQKADKPGQRPRTNADAVQGYGHNIAKFHGSGRSQGGAHNGSPHCSGNRGHHPFTVLSYERGG